MCIQRQQLFPLSITKHDRRKATKTDFDRTQFQKLGIREPTPTSKSAAKSMNIKKMISLGYDDPTGIAFENHDNISNEGTALVGVDELPAGLKKELMPRHVAVMLDGNRRWARKQGLMTSELHEAGSRRLVEFVNLCLKWGIQIVTAFAFSTENWGRSEVEVNYLMSSFERYLKLEMPTFQREGIKVSILGGTSSKIPKSLLNVKLEVEEATKHNSRAHVILAIDYSGRYDILQACRSIAQKAKEGLIQVEDVNESLMDQELETNCAALPNPDLLIRTSGEHRISNFYLWQMA